MPEHVVAEMTLFSLPSSFARDGLSENPPLERDLAYAFSKHSESVRNKTGLFGEDASDHFLAYTRARQRLAPKAADINVHSAVNEKARFGPLYELIETAYGEPIPQRLEAVAPTEEDKDRLKLSINLGNLTHQANRTLNQLARAQRLSGEHRTKSLLKHIYSTAEVSAKEMATCAKTIKQLVDRYHGRAPTTLSLRSCPVPATMTLTMDVKQYVIDNAKTTDREMPLEKEMDTARGHFDAVTSILARPNESQDPDASLAGSAADLAEVTESVATEIRKLFKDPYGGGGRETDLGSSGSGSSGSRGRTWAQRLFKVGEASEVRSQYTVMFSLNVPPGYWDHLPAASTGAYHEAAEGSVAPGDESSDQPYIGYRLDPDTAFSESEVDD